LALETSAVFFIPEAIDFETLATCCLTIGGSSFIKGRITRYALSLIAKKGFKISLLILESVYYNTFKMLINTYI